METTTDTTTDTGRTAARYKEARERLTAVLDAVPTAAWNDPSPCEGWTARDVVRHLVETQRSFLTGHGFDLGPVPDLDDDPAAGWRAHAERVAALVADESVLAREYDGHFGPTTIGDTLLHFYVFDMVVHRWDVARATGGDTRLSDDELDRIERGAARFGDALYREGVCKPGVEAPQGAGRQTRALAILGRRG